MHYNGKAAIAKGHTPWYEENAWLLFSMLFFPLFFVGLFSNRKILPQWKWTIAGAFVLCCRVSSLTHDPDKSYRDADVGQSVSGSPYQAAVKSSSLATPSSRNDVMAKREASWQERLTAEKAYVTQMVELMGTWGAAYQKLGGMLSQYGSSPELLQDESWRAGFVGAMVTAQLASKQIQSIQNVPNNAKKHHRLWTKAAQEGDMGLALLVRGIDKQRADLITQGLPHFRRGVDLSNEANSELENMKQRMLKEAQNH